MTGDNQNGGSLPSTRIGYETSSEWLNTHYYLNFQIVDPINCNKYSKSMNYLLTYSDISNST